MNAHAVRKDFPILAQEVRGRRLVYLDNAATSQKPRQVIEALKDYYESYNANVHRSVHILGERATEAYEGARLKLAAFIGAPSDRSMIFTKSATEAINLIAYAWARKRLREDDEVICTEMEHHSNLVPWQLACADTGAVLRHIPVTDEGALDMAVFHKLLSRRTKLVCVTHVSNVLGTINPIRDICRAAHDVGALVLVDSAQGVPHMAVDVAEMGCDFLALTGHKMCGPTGIGALWGREELLEEMGPFLGGGEMIMDVWLDRATYNAIPYKFEAGTPPIGEAVALGAAIDYLSRLGMQEVRAHEVELTRYALGRLSESGDIQLFGPRDPSERAGVISFNVGDIHAHDVGTILDAEGIAVRAGHHCAKPLMRRLGVSATARASFYVYNTHEDVDALVDGLKRVGEIFGVPAAVRA